MRLRPTSAKPASAAKTQDLASSVKRDGEAPHEPLAPGAEADRPAQDLPLGGCRRAVHTGHESESRSAEPRNPEVGEPAGADRSVRNYRYSVHRHADPCSDGRTRF